MSRTYEALAEKESTGNAVAVIDGAALETLKETIARNLTPQFLGERLRFVKGKYVAGQDKRSIPAGTRLVAILGGVQHGWIKWENQQPSYVIGRTLHGYREPKRDELGNLDQSKWQIGLSGKAEDPWRRAAFIPLYNARTEEAFTLALSTVTGVGAAWTFLDRVRWLGEKFPGRYPVIELRVGGFEGRFGHVDVPELEIVDWAAPREAKLAEAPALAGPEEPSERNAFDDEIPF